MCALDRLLIVAALTLTLAVWLRAQHAPDRAQVLPFRRAGVAA